MSSHREAPEISKDPVADNTDTYAFVSPDKPNTVTLIANFIPSQIPEGGPNFYEFGDDVLYEINISNRGKAQDDITYQFRFTTMIRNPNTFLYNTGQITKITDATWNRPQIVLGHSGGAGQASATAGERPALPAGQRRGFAARRTTPRWRRRRSTTCRAGGRCSPVSAGRVSTSTWAASSISARCGPFQNLHLIPSAAAAGVNGTQATTCTPSRCRCRSGI